MTTRWQLLVLGLAAAGLLVSLAAFPIEPYDRETMEVLESTGATVENWKLERLDLSTPTGQPVTLADFRGRPVYLTYWAEWCDVCKQELPNLDAFARAAGDRVEVVAVSIDDDPSASLDYLARHFPGGPGFDVLVDPGGSTTNQFRTTGVPETFVIDPEGTVLARYIGAHDFTAPAHRRLIDHLLQER